MTISWVRDQLRRHRPEAIAATVAPRRAAVAIIVAESSEATCSLLFIRRSRNHDDPWSGHMAFPGGRLDPDDDSALHAARRETLEEVGIDLGRHAELLGQLDDLRASARGAVLPMAITPFVFHLLRPVALRCNEEVAEALWIPVQDLLDPASAGSVPYELGGDRFDLPCFNVSGQTIWGLTYQMLMQLFRVIGWQPGLVSQRPTG